MSKRQKSIYKIALREPPETQFSAKNLKDEEIEKIAHRDKYRPSTQFVSMAEKLAKSSIYYRNWYYPEAKDKFPYDIEMRYVDKMFPLADGGPLLIDEPDTEARCDKCLEKQELLRELGYRYLIINKGDDFLTLATSLEERDRQCRGQQR